MSNGLVGSYSMFTHNFTGIRVKSQLLQSVSWCLEVPYVPAPGIDDAKLVHATSQKLIHWLRGYFVDTVFLDVDDQYILEMMNSTACDNSLVYLPGEPTNTLIAKTVRSKLTTLANGVINLGTISLMSSDTYYSQHCASSEGLPDINYVGTGAYHTVPWWKRHDLDTYDITTCDFIECDEPPSFSDINTEPYLVKLVDHINQELGLGSDESGAEIQEIPKLITNNVVPFKRENKCPSTIK